MRRKIKALVAVRTLSAVAALAAALTLGNSEARAQDEDVPRVELGVQFSSLTISEPNSFFSAGRTRTEPGAGARVTYNLNPSVAVEAEGNLFPSRSFSRVGGRTLQGQFGVKAGRRFERFGLFAKVRPGFVSFSDVVEYSADNTVPGPGGDRFFVPSSRTRAFFSTDVGGVLEFYPSRRLVTRFDFGDTIVRYGERNDLAIDFIAPDTFRERLIRLPAETSHNFQFSAGVGFRF
ncbi:MAG TPA: outer membrane beta-barrel protein [Pyrinomonadaceae bacterium]|nr:outer membrane beta-barrel protein [Pyrinomonadaceae bacterium]